MRRTAVLLVLLVPALAGCSPWTEPAGAFLAANAASVVVFGKAIPDLAVSGISGRDCSIVHLDQGKSYCTPQEPPPKQPEFCTRSLARVDCWTSAAVLPEPQEGVADGPSKLTAAQERERTARWPKSLTAFPAMRGGATRHPVSGRSGRRCPTISSAGPGSAAGLTVRIPVRPGLLPRRQPRSCRAAPRSRASTRRRISGRRASGTAATPRPRSASSTCSAG